MLILCSAMPASAQQLRPPEGKPYFLVASSDLYDPVFRHSVILIVPTTELPLVAGVIINEPTATPAHMVFPDVPAFKDLPNPTYFGGPVDNGEPTILARAANPIDKAIHLLDDVYVSTDHESIAAMIKDPAQSSDLRVISGRAQWKSDQLQMEITEGAWYIAPANAEMIFSTEPTRLWRKLVSRAELLEASADRYGFHSPFDLELETAAVEMIYFER
ncbi:MAG TPA: YqgE/AlgH family protein [Candidatus Binataceae bacterium]|nr:YqgE/AlgH family protein [Candidatus Binataceae bacterium]